MSLTKVHNRMVSGAAVNVKDFGAVGDGVTDDTAAIQAAIDSNQTGKIVFPSGTYKCGSSVILTNTAGKNFQGNLIGVGNVVIDFTNDGDSGDPLSSMNKGFVAFHTTATGEFDGWKYGVVENLTINSPNHGVGFWLSNSGYIKFNNVTLNGGRYGICCDGSISVSIVDCAFFNFSRAGVGFIKSSDSNVYYASAYFNDSYVINKCSFAGTTSSGFAIEDHGTSSFGTREITNTTLTSVANNVYYFYIGQKNVILNFKNNWCERTPVMVRFVASTETTGTIPGTTFNFSDFPGGSPINIIAKNNHALAPNNSIDDLDMFVLNGLIGNAEIAENFSQGTGNGSNVFLTNTQNTGCILDGGNKVDAGTYKSITYEFNSAGDIRYKNLKRKKESYFFAQHLSGTASSSFPDANNKGGVISIGNASSDGNAGFLFDVPDDPANISYKVIIFSKQTGNVAWRFVANYAASGESYDTGNILSGVQTVAVTANEIKEIDISSYIRGTVDSAEYILGTFSRLGSNASDTVTDVYLLGIKQYG